MKQRVFAHLESQEDFAVSLLRKLVRFESVATPSPDPDAPQGRAVADCLACAMREAEKLGLFVTNFDSHALLIDTHKEESADIGILCHLDVVPAGDGWVHPPFDGIVEDGRFYGRGATDDKGPFVSALLAVAALKACGIPLAHPIRLIAGTAEETGSSDIAYCKARGVIPPHVFSPDAHYPVVNTEKGILRFQISAPIPAESRLTSICGGEVINMVPQHAVAHFSDGTTLAAQGQAAHASTPEGAENAVCRLLLLLKEELNGDPAESLIRAAYDLSPCKVTDGSALHINAEDEIAGALTASLDLAKTENGTLSLSFDVRYPLCCTEESLKADLTKRLSATPFVLTDVTAMPPHHVPENSPFVQSLLCAYREVSGHEGYCTAMGGGTYVHDIDGGVAFGTVFPEEDCRIHSPDEYIPVKHLILNAKIFAAALLRLQEETL